MSTESPKVREQDAAVDESDLLASSPASGNREQNDLLTTWRDFQENPATPPARLLEVLGNKREAFLQYLSAPDRDEHGRGLALLDVCVERATKQALSLENPAWREQIRSCLASAIGESDPDKHDELVREALRLAKQGCLEDAAWEAVGRAVDRRERSLREARRVLMSQGQVVTAAAAMDAVSKAIRALVPFIPGDRRSEARAALERALDDRTRVLLSAMRWWMDQLVARRPA